MLVLIGVFFACHFFLDGRSWEDSPLLGSFCSNFGPSSSRLFRNLVFIFSIEKKAGKKPRKTLILLQSTWKIRLFLVFFLAFFL